MTDTEEALLVDHYNNVSAYTPPEWVYLGLATDGSVPDTEAGTGITEPDNGSWARVAVRGEDFWGDAQASTDGVTYQSQNAQAVEFENANDSADDLKYVIEWNDPTGTAATNVRRIWTITTAVTPTGSQKVRIEACALKTTIGRNAGSIDVTLQDVESV
jgi:hypothetical protein